MLNNPRDEVSFRVFQCILNSVSRGREARAEGKKVEIKRTSPALTVPTAGDTVRGASAGTINSNDVEPTSTMGPEPILGTGWVNSFALVCELMTSM